MHPENDRNDRGLAVLKELNTHLVVQRGPDLSCRQLAILLTIYLEQPPHTVRGLAQRLNVTKPVITRALNSMGEQDLVARKRDSADMRNVVVMRTVTGRLFLDRLGDVFAEKLKALEP
jgi:DNA-binding MarR family transcriptional regulator